VCSVGDTLRRGINLGAPICGPTRPIRLSPGLNGAKLRAVWDGSRRERAIGIQPGFSPETPDTGWKPMLQCSPECRASSAEKQPTGPGPKGCDKMGRRPRCSSGPVRCFSANRIVWPPGWLPRSCRFADDLKGYGPLRFPCDSGKRSPAPIRFQKGAQPGSL
jgi:hypothetical protein